MPAISLISSSFKNPSFIYTSSSSIRIDIVRSDIINYFKKIGNNFENIEITFSIFCTNTNIIVNLFREIKLRLIHETNLNNEIDIHMFLWYINFYIRSNELDDILKVIKDDYNLF